MAPELFGENYNELVDIYSFAIVLLLDLVDAVFITHVLLLFLCPMWATHGRFSGPGRLVQAFSSTLYRFRSIAYGLRTWPSLLPLTVLAHPTSAHLHAKRHDAHHTQHNSTWHLRLVISIIKHIWNLIQLEKSQTSHICVDHSQHTHEHTSRFKNEKEKRKTETDKLDWITEA